MKITWVGHACFLIETEHVRIVTDPFDRKVPYSFPQISADVVTVSHEHSDHNAVTRVSGHAIVVRDPGIHHTAGIDIQGIASAHDASGGSQRGANTMFAFTLDGIRLAHLGDLGTALDESQRAALRSVEVLLVPVGGFYTIDAAQADALIDSLPDVRVVFPMHYRTRAISDWPIAPLDAFLRTKDNARHIGSSNVSLTKATLPGALEVWVLDHA